MDYLINRVIDFIGIDFIGIDFIGIDFIGIDLTVFPADPSAGRVLFNLKNDI
jgi:hypothetical protein